MSKKKVKITYDITIQKAEWTFGYTKLQGQAIHASYAFGAKSSEKGETKPVALDDDHVMFNLKLKPFQLSMKYEGDMTAPKFKNKKIQFSLFTGAKEPALIGKADFDLALVSTPGKFDAEQKVEMLGKDKKPKKTNPRVVVLFKCEWAKVDGKKIVDKKDKKDKKDSKSKGKSNGLPNLGLDDDDDLTAGLGDLASDSAFGKKNASFRSKDSDSEDDYGGAFGMRKKQETVTLNGKEVQLVEDDEMSISEADTNWDGDKTDADYLSDEDDPDKGSNDVFAQEDEYDKHPLPKSAAVEEKPKSLGNTKDTKPAASPKGSALSGDGSDDDLAGSDGSDAPSAAGKTKKKSGSKKKSGKSSLTDSKKSSHSHSSSSSSASNTTSSTATLVSKPKPRPSGSGSSSEVQVLEFKIASRERIVDYIYTSSWDYDNMGNSTSALKLANYLCNSTECFHKTNQFNTEHLTFQQDILVAIFKQYTKYLDDPASLLGWLSFSITLMTSILKQGPSHVYSPPPGDSANDPKWVLNVSKTGMLFRFASYKVVRLCYHHSVLKPDRLTESVIQALEKLEKPNLEKEFSELSQDTGSPSTAFLQILDKLITHNYCLAVSFLRRARFFPAMHSSAFEDLKLTLQRLEDCGAVDAFFDKEVVSTNRKSKTKALNRLTHIVHQFDTFIAQSRLHRIPRQVEAQALGQVMYLINASLVNQLLQTASLCNAGSAFSIKATAAHIEGHLAKVYISNEVPKAARSVPSTGANQNGAHIYNWITNNLEAIREAANLLQIEKVIFNSDPKEITSVFTCLTLAQITKLLQQFRPDEFATDSVPESALRALLQLVGAKQDKQILLDASQLLKLPKQ